MKILSQLLITMLIGSSALAGATSLSFNGNLAGTSSINSLVLVIYSGSCNLYSTADYGSVALDGDGNFSVNISAVGGTFLGNAGGANYTTLSEIFDTTNTNILGQSSCTVNGSTAAWAVSVTVNGTQLSGSVPINAVPFAVNAQTAVNAQKIGGTQVSAVAPTSNQILQYSGGVWAPATIAAGGGVTSVSGTSPLISTGGSTPVLSLAGLSSLGTANQLLGMNAAGTGYEYKTLSFGAGP